ncbi:unnamed protein product [Allacma fusca]|uniref:Uncharacterized protein n=1 Tax=Allacma fusca TaxID=39272 RepID=A0A8J2KJ35_9HEXA|nr:unnamed protein product [Allacma fusca]
MGENILKSTIELNIEPEETLPQFLLRKAHEHFENEKTIWMLDAVTEESHTFGNFEEETRKVASFLFKRGMRKGDVAIYMNADIVHNQIFLAGVWRANGIARASYPEDDQETLLSRLEESKAGWIYCEREAVDMCKDAASYVDWDVDVIVQGEELGCVSFTELLEDDGCECPESLTTMDDPALILCTSGTTGRSKGAVHTHKSFLYSIVSATGQIPLVDDQPNLIVSKGTHVTGALLPFAALIAGKLALVLPIITKENLFHAVDKYKPAFIWGFPTFICELVNGSGVEEFDFSSVQYVASGGTLVTPTIEGVIRELPGLEAVITVFGLTESPLVCSTIDMEEGGAKAFDDVPGFSVGKVSPGVTLTIRDPETGNILGLHERGEICVKSELNFSHYLNNEEATENSFIDGYFKTGDLGYFDEVGFIFIVDRLKEIFKYYNNHISPTEIEDVINQHEAVKEVSVIGIEDPEGGGSIPRAVVTVKNEEVTSEEILEFANERLPDYKKIRGGLFILEELPRGKTGKITRNLVAQLNLGE